VETEVIETPVGKQKITLKKWLTGKDRRDLNLILLGDIEFSINPTNPDNPTQNQKIKGSKIVEMTDKTMELVIAEIEGKPEDILKKLGEMDIRDYDFVSDKVNQISNQQTQKKT